MLPVLLDQFRIGLTCADILLTFLPALRVLSVRVLISATSDPTRGELDGPFLLALAQFDELIAVLILSGVVLIHGRDAETFVPARPALVVTVLRPRIPAESAMGTIHFFKVKVI